MATVKATVISAAGSWLRDTVKSTSPSSSSTLDGALMRATGSAPSLSMMLTLMNWFGVVVENDAPMTSLMRTVKDSVDSATSSSTMPTMNWPLVISGVSAP